MRRFRVMVGMTVLIIFFHVLYFNFGNRKVPVEISTLKNDHQKINKLTFKDDCPDCCRIIFYAYGSIYLDSTRINANEKF